MRVHEPRCDEGAADVDDAIGGVEVNLRERVKSKISGGASNGGITLKLDRGENTLDGQQALALARTRSNARNPTEDDTDRAARQQLILRGIKDRLTSPWRAPINFIRGPWIAWNAPIGLPNCSRSFAYWTAMSSMRRERPTS